MAVNDTLNSKSSLDESSDSLVCMKGIKKDFGSVRALRGVDISLRKNEILGLTGDNGAGKSTLIKTLIGIHEPSAGEIFIRGEQVDITSPRQAKDHGIATVFQDLALIDEQSVAENIFLGRIPTTKFGNMVPIVDWETMYRRSTEILEHELNIDINPKTKVKHLSGGERQAVAIGRALVTEPDIIIMDEPTSALSADSAERVRSLVERLKSRGVSVILISHNMDEIISLTDRVTLLDSGELVGTFNTKSVTTDSLSQMVVTGAPVEGPVEDSDFP